MSGLTAKEIDVIEAEATRFAVCLLMPKELVKVWMKRNRDRYPPFDLANNEMVKACAREFGVPIGVAVLRLREFMP